VRVAAARASPAAESDVRGQRAPAPARRGASAAPIMVAAGRTHPNTKARRPPAMSPARPAMMNSAPRLGRFPVRAHRADSGEA